MDSYRLIPVANAVKCALRFTQNGLEAYNILNVLGAGPASAANLVTIAGVFQNWWNTTHRALLSNNVNWVGMDLTALDGPGSPFLAYSNSGTLVGAVAAAIHPPQVTVCVSLRTGLSGRSFRGRLFHIGMTASTGGANGLIPQGSANTIAGSYNTLRTSLATAGWPLCVVSYFSGIDGNGDKIPRAAGLATVITSVACGVRVDTQRRRLPVEARA